MLINALVYSQEVKFIVKQKNGFNEEYYVLKDNKRIKHGTYVKYITTIINRLQILESGSYKNGEKEGLWEYFYKNNSKNTKNSIKERGYYVNGKKNGLWTYYFLDHDPNITNLEIFGKKKKVDSIAINIDLQTLKSNLIGQYLNDKRIGEWTSFDFLGNIYQKYDFSQSRLIFDASIKDSLEYNRNRVPLFIGGLPCFNNFLLSEKKFRGIYPYMKKDSISAIVSFNINKFGDVSEPMIVQNNGRKQFGKEIIRLINLLDMKWIPALKNSQTVESTYKIEFNIKRENETKYSGIYRINFYPIFN